jgi:hypothetical protein
MKETSPSKGRRGGRRRARCRRSPERTAVRHVAFVVGRVAPKAAQSRDRRKRKLDSDVGRDADRRRLGMSEPGLGNRRPPKRRNRFTRRGRRHVHPPGQMDGMGQNLEKLQRYGRLEERMHAVKSPVGSRSRKKGDTS